MLLYAACALPRKVSTNCRATAAWRILTSLQTSCPTRQTRSSWIHLETQQRLLRHQICEPLLLDCDGLWMDKHLHEIDFTLTNADPCLYCWRSGTASTIIGHIVDDIVCATSGVLLILLGQLKQRFETTYEGELSYILGLHVTRDLSTGHVFLDQQGYIKRWPVRK